VHPNVIWIVSLGSVFVFFTMNDHEVIYPCPFAFNFSSNMLVLFLVCFNLYYKKEDCFGGDVYFRLPVIIKSNNLHAVTLEGRWVR
jgi:phosphoglycerol transferase MdoB-like AlkP superfamily enzyme